LWTCGTLGKVHGLRGELYLKVAPGGVGYLEMGTTFFLADPSIEEREDRAHLIACVPRRVGGTDLKPILQLDLANTRDEAIALQGLELLACGGELEDLPHFRVGDLIGLRVETAAGRPLGVVSDVLETPVHEVLEIKTPQGGPLLVPLVDQVVTIDEAQGVARVIDGLVDDVAGGSA
jgi:16S rRNA processing protein RimM